MLRQAIVLLLLVNCSGCAFLNRDNLVLFDGFERTVVPDASKQPGLHAATAVLTYPAGLFLLLLDTLVTHPVLVVDDAWHDAREALWRNFNWKTQYVTEVTVLPLRAVSTPIFFLGDFLARSVFDIEGKASRKRRKDRQAREREGLSQVEQGVREAYQRKDQRRVLALLKQHRRQYNHDPAWNQLELLGLCAVAELNEADSFRVQLARTRQVKTVSAEQLQLIVAYARRADWTVRLLLAKQRRPLGGGQILLPILLADKDPVVRWFALKNVQRTFAKPAVSLAPTLQDKLRDDPSEAVRGLARTIFKR